MLVHVLLAFGMLTVLLLGSVGGLVIVRGEVKADKAKDIPNRGIRRTARSAILVGFAVGCVSAMAYGLGSLDIGLPNGLLYGLAGGLSYGGYACLSHAALRLVLWRLGAMPLDYARFLDYATGCGFLKKDGGGYSFVYQPVREFFASQRANTHDRDVATDESPHLSGHAAH